MVIGKGIAVLLPVVLDLVRDGGGVFLDELGNGLEGHALSEAVLNHLALLHLAFFVAVFAVPAFAFHAALVEVDLLLRQHDDVWRDAEAELAIAPGKDDCDIFF